MKSLTAVCQTGASMPAINPNGRISRHPHHRGDGENAEMKMYLSKLKDLVPFMPKDRKLSKLEIIQYVIDYICDLQSELETHPDVNNFDAETALNYPITENDGIAVNDDLFADRLSALDAHNLQQQPSSPATRQPLVDRQAPNTILPKTPGTSNNISIAQVMQLQQQQLLATAHNSQPSEVKDDSSSSSGNRPQC